MFNAKNDATPAAAPADVMLQMIAGFWVSRAVWAAAELGLPDKLPTSAASCSTPRAWSPALPITSSRPS